MQSATHMHDPSLYNNLLTGAELMTVVISCNITALRRTDCRINVSRMRETTLQEVNNLQLRRRQVKGDQRLECKINSQQDSK